MGTQRREQCGLGTRHRRRAGRREFRRWPGWAACAAAEG
uniref:Uncharacterized protein n=1 Tax=Arundo donax TaxID=35708 RepID=A0A0A8XPM5_ARUDO